MSKPLYSSASKIETADILKDGCMRKWFFAYILKLPEVRKGSFVFGEVLHSCCERYLLADENGCDKDGKPVDLYPKGWESPVNKYTGLSEGGIDLAEQALVKTLVAKAIKEGILTRIEGREVEKPIRSWAVMDGVLINGFIDWLEPGAIRDHKSTKAMKWAKSVRMKPDGTWPKNALRKNIQMCLYGYWYYTKGGWPKELPLKLSHQYFVKDPQKPHVELREDEVTWKWVDTFFKDNIQPILELMLVYRDSKDFKDIPLPDNPQTACSKFGGCPFQTLCTDQETVKQYQVRIERELTGINKTNYKQVADNLKGDKDMSEVNAVPANETAMQKKIREMREKREAQAAGTSTPVAEAPKAAPVAAKPEPAPEPKPTPVVEEAAVEAAGDQTAPWYRPGCKMCSGNSVQGLSEDGERPCKMCLVFAEKEGRKHPDSYTWTVSDGTLIVVDNETGDEVVTSKVVEEPTAKEVIADPVVEEPVAQPETVTASAEPVVEEPVVTAPEAVAPPAEFQTQGEDLTVGGVAFEDMDFLTERSKFSIVIGCAVTESQGRGGGKFGSPACRATGEEILCMVEAEMCKILTTAKWRQMNSFAKKDAVALYAKDIAAMIGKSTVVVSVMPKSSLMEAIILAIRPYAGLVIQALA